MKRIHKQLCASLVAALMSLPAQADSLVTITGQIVIGEVHKTDAGYSVQTKTRLLQFKAEDVRTILWDHAPVSGSHGGSPHAVVKPADPRTLSLLLQQGQSALAAGEFGDARNAFGDALAIDPKNSIAGRGLGLAYLKLKKPEKAAQPLEIAAQGQPLDRGLTLALASAEVAAHDAIDAAKTVQTYLQSHPDADDETVVNALGIALWQTDPAAMHTPVFLDGVKLYSTLNTRLETNQPGKRRWGIEWLPAADVAERKSARRAAQAKVDQTWNDLQDVNKQLQAAEKDAASPAKHPEAQSQVAALKDKQQTAQSDYDAADADLAKLPGPVYPPVIELADADLPKLGIGSDKRVTRYAAAFAVAPDVFVTAADSVDGAADIQVTTFEGKTFKATVLRMHHGDGLALLEVAGAKLPCLKMGTALKPGSLICLGFADVDLFTPVAKPIEVVGPEVSSEWAVHFAISPRIPGAPLLKEGAVVGVELGDRDSNLAAVPAATLRELQSLADNELPPTVIATDVKKAVVLLAAQH